MFVETEARPAGEPAKVGTLKLSEAMREGAKHFTQGSHYFGPDGCACALGAAAWAAGYRQNGSADRFIVKTFGSVPGNVITKIHWMNACRSIGPEFSYEGIADWLEAQGY